MNTVLILKATSGELEGKQFAFTSPSYCVLGRSRSCTVRLPGDETVSRQHCLIELDPRGIWVQDLGSLNGTLINGAKIGQRQPRHDDATMVQPARQLLQDGDELRICRHTFSVQMFDGEHSAVPGYSSSWEQMAMSM